MLSIEVCSSLRISIAEGSSFEEEIEDFLFFKAAGAFWGGDLDLVVAEIYLLLREFPKGSEDRESFTEVSSCFEEIGIWESTSELNSFFLL
jgi:hypothetical protein